MAAKKTGETLNYFETQRAEFAAAQASWRALEREEETIRVAAQWQAMSDGDRNADRGAWLRAKVTEHYPNGKLPAPWRIAALAADVAERMELARPAWLDANQRWAVARARETSRVAISMQDRQRVVVKKIADAAQALSLAIADERELHAELARTTPNGVSPYLARCAPAIAPLSDPAGALFAWRRKMRQLNLL